MACYCRKGTLQKKIAVCRFSPNGNRALAEGAIWRGFHRQASRIFSSHRKCWWPVWDLSRDSLASLLAMFRLRIILLSVRQKKCKP